MRGLFSLVSEDKNNLRFLSKMREIRQDMENLLETEDFQEFLVWVREMRGKRPEENFSREIYQTLWEMVDLLLYAVYLTHGCMIEAEHTVMRTAKPAKIGSE